MRWVTSSKFRKTCWGMLSSSLFLLKCTSPTVSSGAGLSPLLRTQCCPDNAAMSAFSGEGFRYNPFSSYSKLCPPFWPFIVIKVVFGLPLVLPLVLFPSWFSAQVVQKRGIIWFVSESPQLRRKIGLHILDQLMRRFKSWVMLILCTVWRRS